VPIDQACYVSFWMLDSHRTYIDQASDQSSWKCYGLSVCVHSTCFDSHPSDIFRSSMPSRWGDGFGWFSKDHHFVQLFRFPGGATGCAQRQVTEKAKSPAAASAGFGR
jgi:hypothetical protein